MILLKLYRYYFYRVYKFHDKYIIGATHIPAMTTIGNICLWEQFNVMRIWGYLLDTYGFTKPTMTGIFVIIIIPNLIMHIIVFNKDKMINRLKEEFKDVSPRKNKLADILIIFYMILSIVVYFI